jgi:hypothetical protein
MSRRLALNFKDYNFFTTIKNLRHLPILMSTNEPCEFEKPWTPNTYFDCVPGCREGNYRPLKLPHMFPSEPE